MNIQLKEIPIEEVVKGYSNSDEAGVVALGGKLNVRPAYQREFVYKDKQRDAVIETVSKGLPLNTMYWVDHEDGTYEVLDGQQRTISICQYISGVFSLNYKYFHNLTEDEKNHILNYRLMVYICTGADKEKLEWFRTINVAGEEFTEQELRNSVYAGPWLSDAKKYFSKTGGPAYSIANEYVRGIPKRQEYLETAIAWINKGAIEEYMAKNQQESNANEIWLYFQSVINWVKATFPNYRREMKGLPWGLFYNELKNEKLDPVKLEQQVAALMQDEDVERKPGIYPYLLFGGEKYLNIRVFSPAQKREAYERQKGICTKCGEYFEIEDMEADHITPWHLGGKTTSENCQVLCKGDNRTKSGK